jgi:predicted methyltransferase
MFTRRRALGCAVVLAFSASAGLAFAQATLKPSDKVPPIPAYVQKAVDSSTRSDKDKTRDAGRKPAAVFAYSGIKPGDKVIEIAAFGQYDTNIMINIVGDKGRIYMYDLPYQQVRQEVPTKAFTDAHPNTTHVFGKFDELSFPKGVDAVTIDMYYHDLGINKVDQTVFNKQMFDALKPGGKVLIVDHNAVPGLSREESNKIHRIDPALILSEMQAAGFKLVVNSTIFAIPNDDKTKVSFSPGERGSTDRSLFVFEKPKK